MKSGSKYFVIGYTGHNKHITGLVAKSVADAKKQAQTLNPGLKVAQVIEHRTSAGGL